MLANLLQGEANEGRIGTMALTCLRHTKPISLDIS